MSDGQLWLHSTPGKLDTSWFSKADALSVLISRRVCAQISNDDMVFSYQKQDYQAQNGVKDVALTRQLLRHRHTTTTTKKREHISPKQYPTLQSSILTFVTTLRSKLRDTPHLYADFPTFFLWTFKA